MTEDLQALGAPVRERFQQMHDARERAFQASRDVIRNAANAIRAIHRREHDTAEQLLQASHEALVETLDAATPHPEVLWGGFVQDAAKEYAEARLTRAAIDGDPLPGPDEVGVDDGSWLHGLGETVGELRRAALDRVRGGDLAQAEAYLDQMQEILSLLVTIDVPDALTRGLRRKTDGARAITERTRGDLTAAMGQQSMKEALDRHREVVEQLLEERG